MTIIQLNLFEDQQCKVCREWKAWSGYRKGARNICKRCVYKREKELNAPRLAERHAATKQWQQQNKERYDDRRRAWRKNNKTQVNRFTQRRRALIRANGGSYTYGEWDALCAKYNNACLCCGEITALTPDHIVPVTKGGTSDIGNIQPLCMDCNRRKRDKTIDYRPRE